MGNAIEGELDQRSHDDLTSKNLENDTPRIRSSSISKPKCDDGDKIVESGASAEPLLSSSRPSETTPSVGGSKDMDTNDGATVTVCLFLFCIHACISSGLDLKATRHL